MPWSAPLLVGVSLACAGPLFAEEPARGSLAPEQLEQVARGAARVVQQAQERLAQPAAEPGLAAVAEAAARVAAGPVDEDASRLSRARAAHWAPVVRTQLGGKSSAESRDGEQRAAPLRWNQAGSDLSWQVSATWDFSQLVYDRDENQLALARSQLAVRRREASEQAGRLYTERRELLAQQGLLLLSRSSALHLLRLTAQLDQLTGGLYAAQVQQAQALVDRLAPSRSPDEAR